MARREKLAGLAACKLNWPAKDGYLVSETNFLTAKNQPSEI